MKLEDNHCRKIHTPIYGSIKESQPSRPNAKKISPGAMWQCSKIVNSFIYRPGWVFSSACWKCNHGPTRLHRSDCECDAVGDPVSSAASPHADRLWLGLSWVAGYNEGGARPEIYKSLMEACAVCTQRKSHKWETMSKSWVRPTWSVPSKLSITKILFIIFWTDTTAMLAALGPWISVQTLWQLNCCQMIQSATKWWTIWHCFFL